MKSLRSSLFVALLFALAVPAFAWNCSDPLASRVDVGPVNPGGSAGDGDGQWYKGSDAANPNDYYVCEVPKKTPPTTTPTTTTQTQTQTQGQSQTQGQTANGGSSSSTATGGNSTATGGSATGGSSSSKSGVSNSGNSTATGGAGGAGGAGGSVSGSGNSTVGVKNTNNVNTTVAPVITSTNKLSNSGNSSNTNTTTSNANGNGSNNQTSASSNQSSSNSNQSSAAGAGANSNDTTNNIAASKIPVNTAYAPTTIPTSPCLKGYSAGGQGAAFGFAIGGSKEDKNCELIELARSFDSMNERLAGCKIKISSKLSKDAGVTLADCMAVEMIERPMPVPPPAPVTPQQPIVVVVPQAPAAAVVAPVVPVAPPTAIVWDAICTFNSKTSCAANGSDAVIIDPARPTSVCKLMIDSAVRAFRQSPGSKFVLVGNRNRDESELLPTVRANNVRRQLETAGVPSSSIAVQVGSGTTRTVEIVLIQAN